MTCLSMPFSYWDQIIVEVGPDYKIIYFYCFVRLIASTNRNLLLLVLCENVKQSFLEILIKQQ